MLPIQEAQEEEIIEDDGENIYEQLDFYDDKNDGGNQAGTERAHHHVQPRRMPSTHKHNSRRPHNPEDVSMEYEEVRLRRPTATSQLGITLRYGPTTATTADATSDAKERIFVQSITPGSVAQKSKRVRIGDQILEVNSTAVSNRREAMREFAKASAEISLLLAREAKGDADDNDDDDDEEIELIDQSTTVLHFPAYGHSSSKAMHTSYPGPIPASAQQQLRSPPQTSTSCQKGPVSGVDDEIARLHRQMEDIRLECDRLMKNSGRWFETDGSNSQMTLSASTTTTATTAVRRGVDRGRQEVFAQPQLISGKDVGKKGGEVVETSSSAYNTGGDSCRSTPQGATQQGQQQSHRTAAEQRSAAGQIRPLHLTVAKKDLAVDLPPMAENYPTSSSTSTLQQTQQTTAPPMEFRLPMQKIILPQLVDSGNCYRPGDIMYTSKDRLSETIALQQRLLKQSLAEQSQLASAGGKGYASQQQSSSKSTGETEYEWKARRRPDGSVYITRRPLRDRIMKAREEQVNKERTGLSTDDDAASELKTGRYWPRHQRRDHMERARERKTLSGQAKLAQHSGGKLPAIDHKLLDLAQRKQRRREGRQLFDGFTTVQEYLVKHGASGKEAGGLLSVTTV